MPSDASIYGMLRQPEPQPGPMDMMAKQLQLRALVDSGQLSALQRQQLEKSIAQEDATESAYRDSGGDPNKLRSLLMGRGLYKSAIAADKAAIDRDKSQAELMTKDRENFVAFADEARKILPTIRTQEQWQAFRDQQQQKAGMFVTPQMRAVALQSLQSLPANYDPNFIRDATVKAEQLFTPKMEERTDGQKKWFVDVNPMTNPDIRNGASVAMQATPGEVLTDRRSRDANAASQGVQTANVEGKIRDDYTNASKPFVTVRDAHQRVLESARDPSAAGDLALIFNYMKVLDPGSTVREGEFATAQNAAGVPQRIMAQYNKVINGERLEAGQRADFVDRSGKLYKAAEVNQEKLEQTYTDIAKRSNANPENVVIKTRISEPARPPTRSEIEAELRRRGVIK